MPIKAIKLRAGFLLLLFTLMFISSNSLITEVNAETLEESFKSTPLPFWEIDNENILTEYGTNTQDISISYGNWIDDCSDINKWQTNANYPYGIENGIVYYDIPNDGNYDYFYTNDISLPIGNYILEILIRDNVTPNSGYGYLHLWQCENLGVPSNQISGSRYLSSTFTILTMAFTTTWITECLSWRYKDSTNAERVYIDYIKIWKEYQEDMSDISEWVFDSSGGLGVGDYSFTTNGDIGDLAVNFDGYVDEWAIYKTPMNYLITEFTKMELKGKVTDINTWLYTGISFGGGITWLSSLADLNWLIQNPNIATHFEKTVDYFYIKLDDNPNSVYGWEHGYFDYINIWEAGGSLNISIPIDQFKNHKFEFMLDTDDLTEFVNLDFGIFQNYNSMNYDFSLENQIFEQRDFSFNYSGHNYLRFKLDLKYSVNLFKISCYDENNSKLFSNIIYEYVRKTGNQFIISSNNFTRWFHLYYFTGDINYETIWKEKIIDEDINIDYSMLASSALDDNMLNDHEIIYNRYISNFQFLRTNMFEYTYFSANLAPKLGIMLDIQFFYPNGIEFYRINGKLYRSYNELVFFMKAYETIDSIESEIFSSVCGSDLGTTEIKGNIQFAIWRTQDNHLAAFYNSDVDNFPDVSEISRFISNKTLDNFQANISITYFSEDILSGYRNFVIELKGFELGYSGLDGVAEPHFSSTWWDSIPILGPIIHAFILVGNAIALAIEAGFNPIQSFIDVAASVVISAIDGIAGSVWVLFESALDNLGISIDAIANDIWGFFETLLDSIAGVIDDIYSTVTDVYTAIADISTNLIASIGTGITNALVPAIVAGISSIIDAMFALWEIELNIAGNALGWGDVGTFIFDVVDSTVLVVPSWLALIINLGTWMINTVTYANFLITEYGPMLYYYGSLFIMVDIVTAIMTMDADKIRECATRYLNVLEKVAGFMFKLISLVLNAIWGILPF